MKQKHKCITKFTIISLLLLFHYKTVSAQQGNFSDNIRFGGGIGLSFGSNFFSGTLEPSAIYQLNPYFAFGAGLNFTYSSEKDFYKSTILGGTLTALANPLENIQLSAEFQELHVNRKYENNFIADEKYWSPALLLGAGFRTNNVTVGIRYDVLYDEYKSVYGTPWVPFVRIYF